MINVKQISRYYRQGVLIDTNLMLLLLVGSMDTEYVKVFDRTRRYSEEDFTMLDGIVRKFHRVLFTPNILTETTYFTDKHIRTNLKESFFETLVFALSKFREEYAPSKDVVNEELFKKFGLADASILVTARKQKCLVLTDDFPLSGYLDHSKIAVLNFNHIRGISLLS